MTSKLLLRTLQHRWRDDIALKAHLLTVIPTIVFAGVLVPLWAQNSPASLPLDPGGLQTRTDVVATVPADLNDYEISPDDLLDIDVFDVKELSGEYRVSPNGAIHLQLLSHPILAAGLTPAQLSDVIEQRLRDSRMITNPEVTVGVKESRIHSVAITGAVKRPQIYPVFSQTTLLDLLSQAEGLTEDAGSIAIVTRSGKARRSASTTQDQQPSSAVSLSFDLKRLLETEPGANPILYPGDRVTVPHAGIFYVLGAVARPGGYNLRDAHEPMTVLMALATAGGPTPTAKDKKVRLIRKKAETPGGRQEIVLNVKEIISGRASDQKMEANDVLFVPESGGKKAGRAVLSSMGAITTTAASGVIVYRR